MMAGAVVTTKGEADGLHAAAGAARVSAAGCPQEIAAYPWPVDEACAVSFCESSWQADAYNAGNYGLFQINAVHAWRVDGALSLLFDPAVNTRVAFAIWSEQGWEPWACKP